MMKFIDRKKLVQILFVIALVVLAANLFIKNWKNKENIITKQNNKQSELSAHEIDKGFLHALNNLGLIDKWIVKKSLAKDKPDSLLYSYFVDIPTDLPITIVLREIFDHFYGKNVNVKADEKVIGGKTILTISSGGYEKLISLFDYEKNIRRKTGKLGFLVTGLENLDADTKKLIIEYPDFFSFIITPSRAAKQFIPDITRNRKEFVILLDDHITDLDFRLKPEYSHRRLKGSIRSIIGNFSKAAFFLIDDKSSLYSSPVYPFVESELLKRKIKLYKESEFYNLVGVNSNELAVKLNKTILNLKEGNSKIIILSVQNFVVLNPEIVKLRKLGYKVILPSKII